MRNGTTLTLGLVGALAAAGALSRRGSRDMVVPETLPSDLFVSVEETPNMWWIQDYGDLDKISITISPEACRLWRRTGEKGGTIVLHRVNHWGLWEVDYIESSKGYGPLLYDLAMEFAFLDGASGVLPDRSGVSESAERVWLRYADSRSDVFKEPPPKDYPSRDKHTMRHRPHLDLVYSKRGTPILQRLRLSGSLQICGKPTRFTRLVAWGQT